MEEQNQLPQLNKLVFLKPKNSSSNQKFSKVINNFLLKSKNFDYLESCYKRKHSTTTNKDLRVANQNVFEYTQPKIIKNSIENNQENKQNDLVSPKSNIISHQNEISSQKSRQTPEKDGKNYPKLKAKYFHKASKSSINSTTNKPITFSQQTTQDKLLFLNADTTQTSNFQQRSKSVSQNTSQISNNPYNTFDSIARRRVSLDQQYLEQDEVLSKQSIELTKSNYISDLSAQEQKLKDSLIKISNQGDLRSYPLSALAKLDSQNILINPLNQSQLTNLQQFSKQNLINNPSDQLLQLNVLDRNRENQNSKIPLTLNSTKFQTKNINIINQTQLQDKDSQLTAQNNSRKSLRSKVKSLHLDRKSNFQPLDEKHVLESRIFQEMHNSKKFSQHLQNLTKNPNQVQLLHDELQLYLPKLQQNSLTHLKTTNNPVQSKNLQYYNQICNYINDFSHSLQDKHQTFDFKSYYSQHQDAMKQQEKLSVAQQIYNTHAHQLDPQTPAHLSDINYYKNLDQSQQFKAQQIYSLLMNINQNFNHLLQIKKGRKKTLKALTQILGYNEQIKNTLLEEDQMTLKKEIDFSQGFSIETWKLVHSKNIKNIISLQKIPIETNFGIDYVPIDEYFNQNLFNYIQNKLQMSERCRRNDLNGYMKNISQMRQQQSNKPIVTYKQLNELEHFDKNVQDIFERGHYVKKEQVIKRLEKYELVQGNFPFIGQLVRLKSKQIDKAQDIFRNKLKN